MHSEKSLLLFGQVLKVSHQGPKKLKWSQDPTSEQLTWALVPKLASPPYSSGLMMPQPSLGACSPGLRIPSFQTSAAAMPRVSC